MILGGIGLEPLFILQFTMIFISFVGIVTGVCIALYGWGLLLYRIAKYPVENRALAVTVGLGAVIFLGGVFNLLRFAYGWTFDGLLIIGVVLAAKYGKPWSKLQRNKSEQIYVVILGLLIIMIMNFTVKTQLPPKVFNWHDDLEKYFAHPVRMLQTGTLFGSPLSALGSETLGGQAVLHGIVLNHFPIPYINGVDAVFGLLLCLILSVSAIPLRAVFLPISLISLLVIFFINQQYVNVSALYIASALMMASILLFSGMREYENGEMGNLPSPILIGLIYAALIAVKSTFVVFPPLHLSFFIIALGLYGVDFRQLVRWSLLTTGTTLLFLLPWVLLHLPHYVHSSLAQTPYRTDITSGEYPNRFLLSTWPLSYGASFAHYTFISMATVLSVLGVVLRRRGERSNSRRIALAGLAASGATIVVAYFLLIALGPAISGYRASIRYAVPFLIAGAPIILSLVYLWAFRDKSFGFKLSFIAAPLLLGVFIVISFSDTLMKRMHQAYESGSILAFSELATDCRYIRYCEEVIHGDTKLRIVTAQKQIPAGQAAVVWVYAPFYLNYERNIIYDVEPAGIASPWAYIPDVNYFMVEYGGDVVCSLDYFKERTRYPGRREQYIAGRCIAFLQSLQEIKQNTDEIYNDGRIVVFKKRGK
jgi:hypothetical protein